MDLNMKYTIGVANYMRDNASAFNLNANDMWVLGYLHNIDEFTIKDNNEENGAEVLHKLGFKFAQYTSWCKTSPMKYCKVHLVEQPPRELILLWKAMYSINNDGEFVGFDKYLKELKLELGLMNLQYMIASETIEWIKEYENSKTK